MADDDDVPILFEPRAIAEEIIESPPVKELTTYQEAMDRLTPVEIAPFEAPDGTLMAGWASNDPSLPYAMTYLVTGRKHEDAHRSAHTHRRLRWAMISARFFQERAENGGWAGTLSAFVVPVIALQDPVFARALKAFLQALADQPKN
jgi:hypothetical protein